MKTQRRWLKSVIAAAASEEVSMPWAARRAAQQGAKTGAMVAANSAAQPQTAAARPFPYAIAAR